MATAQAPTTTDAQRAAQIGLLLAANRQASTALRARVVAMLDHLWRTLGTWHQPDIARFVPQAVGLATAAQRQSAALTSAYLSHYAEAHGAQLASAAPDLAQIRGIDPAVEYERPFHDIWTALADGKTLPEAVDAGATRLESLVTTDMQLAKTKTAQALLSDAEKVVGYRRVLEGAYSCGLCIVASTQRYHKAELMPVHPGCDCSIAPIIGNQDPGKLINAGALADVHAAVQDRFGVSSPAANAIGGIYDGKGRPTLYRDVIVVHENGELGPVLGVRGQDFKGPADLLKTTP